ncbi:MAG: biopolymer transporter ExbD [Bacteroidota bacterium]
MLKKRQREGAEIPTSSMADIAFLLLIFFLVTTTIDVDTGVLMQLPPPLDEEQEPPPIKERNILAVLVNEQGQVLIENEPSSVARVRAEVKRHVLNDGADPRYSEEPLKAIVSIKTARQTPYDVYIDVLDEARIAYREIWDAEARRLGARDYEQYKARVDAAGDAAIDQVKERFKEKISLAEPDPGA